MKVRFIALVAALMFAVPVMAQEQRGAIEGVVKDSSGAVLPGVTVEARSANGAVVATATDNDGVYRFPSVAPGDYVVTASLQGFRTEQNDTIRVGLGQLRKVDFTLAVAGLTETVQVTGGAPLVDARQSSRQTNIRGEQVELLPKGRDFSSLVTQAPGANQEAKLGGLSIDGASAGENRFIVDGIETTDIQHGTQGKGLIADFVEEVQVKSSGYTAEFGGATGGVINVITKSGTNEWRGNVSFTWQGDALQGARRPTLRRGLTDDNIAEYINYPKDPYNRYEPGFSIGGPIVRNRAWFFAGYQPAFTTTERVVNPTTAVNPSAGTFAEDQKATAHNFSANATSQISDTLRGRLAYNNSWSKVDGLLPALSGTEPAGTNYGKSTTFPNYSVSGNLDWVASPRLFFGVRGGYYMSDVNDANVTEEPRIIFSTGNNLGFSDIPDSLRRSSGFQSIPTNFKTTYDEQTRAYVQADGTIYGNFFGDHQLKFGAQFDRVGNNVLSGESANLVRIHWNSALASGRPLTRGTYGYYQVRSNGVNPKQGFITQGDVHTNNIGLFIQDAWTINSRLTINAGVRTERERVPTYTTQADVPEFGIEFGFADKLAPRIGFAYDIKGDGRTKAFGSWGVFYDIFKLELPRGSFGGDKWLEYYYTLDTPDWTTLAASASCPPACPGTLIRGPINFRFVSLDEQHQDPDLKPMRQQEATLGVEHQLNDVLALSVRYVHKQIDRAIEDTGALAPDGTEIYIIANPGENLAALAFTNPNVPNPKPVRDYDSVEFAVEKRLASSWYLRSSYLWSRLYGNYSGLSQSDENGRTSPNVGRLWDYPLMMFQDGGKAALGPLATDRPHQFKAQFIYMFGFGTSLGLNQFVASGLPVSREIGIYPPNNLPVNYLGRGSDGRTPVFSQTDLYVQHGFRIGGSREVQVSLNVLNLFNQDTATSKYSRYHKTNGVRIPDEAAFYSGAVTLESLIASQNIIRDPAFLMDNAFQAPIQARLGVKFLF